MNLHVGWRKDSRELGTVGVRGGRDLVTVERVGMRRNALVENFFLYE